LTDGLTGDLQHILDASNVGARIEVAAIPRSPALHARLRGAERSMAFACLVAGGDDYELCFMAAPARRTELDALSAELCITLTRIGVISAEPGLRVHDEQGAPMADVPRAFDHFR
jgi:thiamine-monophosphate kinase